MKVTAAIQIETYPQNFSAVTKQQTRVNPRKEPRMLISGIALRNSEDV